MAMAQIADIPRQEQREGTERGRLVQKPCAIHDQAEETFGGAEEHRVRGAMVVITF